MRKRFSNPHEPMCGTRTGQTTYKFTVDAMSWSIALVAALTLMARCCNRSQLSVIARPKSRTSRTHTVLATSADTMTWFEHLMGFRETTPDKVREQLVVDGELLHSKANGKTYRHGRLDTPSLSQLRHQTAALLRTPRGRLTVSETIAEARALHTQPAANGALIQAASQFNLLEMVHPGVTPEAGVALYERDPTQGPACAVACGAGTIFRNYFAPVRGRVGQTADAQLDCAREFGDALGNADGALWTMRNGYALGHADGLRAASHRVRGWTEERRDEVRGRLRIGVQYDTEVTVDGGRCGNVVSQAYCSAFPVAYSEVADEDVWEGVARVLLEASYEATLRAAVVNWGRTGCNRVYLTMVGGGVFGNRLEWITGAMERAFEVMKDSGLDVRIVSRGQSRREVRRLERR